MSLFRMFVRREAADGAAPALEALATGITADTLDGLSAGLDEQGPGGAGRRERDANDGAAVVREALGVKLLHGWLQNRHQTLMPLTLNVGNLSDYQRTALARMLASFLLIGRPVADAVEVSATLRSWLGSVGGDSRTLIAFDAAMTSPVPLNEIFDDAQNAALTIYTYVAALMSSDARYPVSVMLCDMVQARFDLPSAAVRSAIRRYRR